MIKITEKTQNDLEFPQVLTQISEFCTTDKGKAKTLKTQPRPSFGEIVFSLHQTREYQKSATHETAIPNHGFDAVDQEIKILSVAGSLLELPSLRKIKDLSFRSNQHLRYFRKYRDNFPALFKTTEDVEYTDVLVQEIAKVVDRFGEMRDDASEELAQIRQAINGVRRQINSSFSSALSRYKAADYLDDIKESIVENVRVLAVLAHHRKKVKGTILGQSKSGRILFIQPEATFVHARKLKNLEYEEGEEIKRILARLTEIIRPYNFLLKDYQDLLSEMDFIAAKTQYANSIDGILPKITKKRELQLEEAYHPLLLAHNNENDEKTYPQDIELAEDNRIIVISGPNAGGKSITLKTVGLIQVMLQSGIMVPVHPYSRVCLFTSILSDIGDHQSIENHLSTYSYRLKNMKHFLRKCDDRTLFLIDEFGTGSDPELGGPLAETFLEVFYEKESFGIITTHYANLKKMASETEAISNANMMFDSKSLKPLFKLQMGEAGSSFTFEVARKNGIPYRLINRSKKKVERGKIRFDRSIAKLQKERSELTKTKNKLRTKAEKAEEEQEKMEGTNTRIQDKLEDFQELFDHNQKMIHLGEKMDRLAKSYLNHDNKKRMVGEFLKIVGKENERRKKQSKKKEMAERKRREKLKAEAEKKIQPIRKEKKEKKEKIKKEKKAKRQKELVNFKENDHVRLEDSKSIGSIDKIEKNKAFVNYGMFTTEVDLNRLELVQKAKN